MKKRLLTLSFLLLLLLTFTMSVCASKPSAVVNDLADVLTDAEEEDLLLLQDRLYSVRGIYAKVLTVSSLDGKTAERYANDYYDAYGTDGPNGGLLLLIDIGGRNWYLLASGATNRNAYLSRIEDALLPPLYESDYAGACEAYLKEAYTAAVVLSGGADEPNFDLSELLVPILVILGVSLLIAFLVTNEMKGKMKTANAKRTAHDYVRDGSFELREQSDLYLYRTRTRTRIRSSNNGGRRSGGGHSGSGSRGGRGGRF